MSHRRKVKDAKKLPKDEPIDSEPYVMEFGASRLVLRGKELYNGWSGPCPRCNSHVEDEQPASEGLRCPHCDHQLYAPGSRADRASVIKELEAQRTSAKEKRRMRLSDEDGVMTEMATGICRFCGGRMEAEDDSMGGVMMYCPACLGRMSTE